MNVTPITSIKVNVNRKRDLSCNIKHQSNMQADNCNFTGIFSPPEIKAIEAKYKPLIKDAEKKIGELRKGLRLKKKEANTGTKLEKGFGHRINEAAESRFGKVSIENEIIRLKDKISSYAEDRDNEIEKAKKEIKERKLKEKYNKFVDSKKTTQFNDTTKQTIQEAKVKLAQRQTNYANEDALYKYQVRRPMDIEEY